MQRAISLLQHYNAATDGDPVDIMYESFTLLSKGGNVCMCVVVSCDTIYLTDEVIIVL